MRFLSVRKPRSARGRRRSARRGRFGNLLVLALLFGASAFLIARLDSIGMRALDGNAVVHDGDTLTIDGERIRLSGIDAFERDQSCSRAGVDYECGEEARRFLVQMVAGRKPRCEGSRLDRYDRLLAVCFVGNTEVNRELVATGWAVSYGAYRTAEIVARINGYGAWEGEFVTPSVWRATRDRPEETRHDIFSRMLEAVAGFLF